MDGKPEKVAAAGRTNDDRAENLTPPDDPTEPTPAPSAEIDADDDVREPTQEETSTLITPVVGDESESADVQASGHKDEATADPADRKTIPPDTESPATPEETEESARSTPVTGAGPMSPLKRVPRLHRRSILIPITITGHRFERIKRTKRTKPRTWRMMKWPGPSAQTGEALPMHRGRWGKRWL